MSTVPKNPSEKKWVTITKQVTDNISPEQAQSIFDAIKQEIGELKLDAQTKESLCLQLEADKSTANAWNTVADVLKHIDIVDIAGKHPKAIKNTTVSILEVISTFFPIIAPATKAASIAVAQMPDSIVAKIVQFGGILTPEHLVHTVVKSIANKKNPVFDKNGNIVFEDDGKENIENTTELIVVCKDSMLSSLFCSLVENEDDFNEKNTKETRSENTTVITLNEKAWLAEQDGGIFEGKILFIGDIKGNDALLQRIDVKYNDFGIKYGWYKNRAIITSSTAKIKNKEVYSRLLAELQLLPIPEKFKSDLKIKFNATTVGKIFLATPILIKDGYDEAVALRRQQLILGIFSMYKNDFGAFLAE